MYWICKRRPQQTGPKHPPKPPPIYIQDVITIPPLLQLLEQVAPRDYETKALAHNQVKVQPKTSATYRAIVKALADKHTEFHTYKPKEERNYRVVLKDMHYFVETAALIPPLYHWHSNLPRSTVATYADDTAVLASDSDPVAASQKLQTHLLAIQHWLHQWRIHANASKSLHVTFTKRSGTCPPVHLNNLQLPARIT
jgi:hypothetical protein